MLVGPLQAAKIGTVAHTDAGDEEAHRLGLLLSVQHRRGSGYQHGGYEGRERRLLHKLSIF